MWIQGGEWGVMDKCRALWVVTVHLHEGMLVFRVIKMYIK